MERIRFGNPLALAVLMVAAFALPASAEGLSWKSYAELGPGLSLAGGSPWAALVMSAGLDFGLLELGSYTALEPMELGRHDLIQSGAARWGADLGLKASLGERCSVFARFGAGKVGLGRTPEGGSGNMTDLRAYADYRLTAGAGLPVGGRWSLRAWGAWDFVPGGEDYEGRSLSGPSLGLSIRAGWETTLR